VKVGYRRGGAMLSANLRAEPPPATPAKDERQIDGRNPFSGATVVNVSPAVAEELGLDPFAGKGVLVTNVAPGFARNAGLHPGDFVRAVNGQAIGSVRDLVSAVAPAQRSWEVTIERGGQQITGRFNI
jgi:S1-C subfamily serine protease